MCCSLGDIGKAVGGAVSGVTGAVQGVAGSLLGGGGSTSTNSNQNSTANVTVTPQTNVTTNLDLEPLAEVLAASSSQTNKAMIEKAKAERDAAALEYKNSAQNRATVSAHIEKVFYALIIGGTLYYMAKKKKKKGGR